MFMYVIPKFLNQAPAIGRGAEPARFLTILLNSTGLKDRATHQRFCNWYLIAVISQRLRTIQRNVCSMGGDRGIEFRTSQNFLCVGYTPRNRRDRAHYD